MNNKTITLTVVYSLKVINFDKEETIALRTGILNTKVELPLGISLYYNEQPKDELYLIALEELHNKYQPTGVYHTDITIHKITLG
jgi:hypothetical protein